MPGVYNGKRAVTSINGGHAEEWKRILYKFFQHINFERLTERDKSQNKSSCQKMNCISAYYNLRDLMQSKVNEKNMQISYTTFQNIFKHKVEDILET